MAKECLACGKLIGAMTSRVILADGQVCRECWCKAGFDISMSSVLTGGRYSAETIRKMIAVKNNDQSAVANFEATKKVGILSFDDNTQTFLINQPGKIPDLYRYNQIVDFELLQDGESITKGGLGSAVVGGLLFGGVGAIVGGITGGKKTKSICKSLQIKITFRDSVRATEYLSFLASATKTSSFIYKNAYKSAQDTLSALQLAVDMVNTKAAEAPASTPALAQGISGADEILKYKNLLDAGIITEEEFKAKKAQILGL